MASFKLYGDGIHDDTDAIQEMLDSGAKLVALPMPEKNYLISRTLQIHSCQELRLDRWAEIKLAPKSNCPMLTNSDTENGNSRIAIRGGIWDFNNLEQAPNPQMLTPNADAFRRMPMPEDYPVDPATGKQEFLSRMFPFHPKRYWGDGFFFHRIDQFELSDVVLKNPVSYAVKMAKISNFTISHVTFDFNEGNPSPNNMDGLHFDGFCRNGRITDLKGNCYDDLLAFNAEDGIQDSPGFGPIENIEVDGVWSDRCHSCVRMLSCGSLIRNITIRNVYGSFYRYAIGFTHFFPERPPRGRFDNIVLENLFISKALPLDSDWNRCPDWGLIWGEGRGTIGSLTINNFHRVETTTPTPAIELESDFEIDNLNINDCSMENQMKEDIVFLSNAGKIRNLSYGVCRCTSAEGAGQSIRMKNTGAVDNIVER